MFVDAVIEWTLSTTRTISKFCDDHVGRLIPVGPKMWAFVGICEYSLWLRHFPQTARPSSLNTTRALTHGSKVTSNPSPIQPPQPNNVKSAQYRRRRSTKSVAVKCGRSIEHACRYLSTLSWIKATAYVENFAQNAVEEKGLTALLDQARQEEPLVEPPPPNATGGTERG